MPESSRVEDWFSLHVNSLSCIHNGVRRLTPLTSQLFFREVIVTILLHDDNEAAINITHSVFHVFVFILIS